MERFFKISHNVQGRRTLRRELSTLSSICKQIQAAGGWGIGTVFNMIDVLKAGAKVIM